MTGTTPLRLPDRGARRRWPAGRARSAERRLAADHAALFQTPAPGGFAAGDLAGLPEPVRRCLRAAIAPGTALAQTARLRMRGHIKVGRWLPFHAEQTLSPHRGFIWHARVAGLIAGVDRYVDGVGAMAWTLLGLPLARAAGPDVTRSAAGRLAGETIWLPTALLPRAETRWTVEGPDQITATHHLGATTTQVTYQLDPVGHITALAFDRWGDPDSTGSWNWHRFGGDLGGHHTLNGLTIPTVGRIGWHYGTTRWDTGEFFRFQLTSLDPLATPPQTPPR
jgi:hypothetical protein